ncbi:MAG: SDR family NAD(P)-dependent oxidoreductase [Pyrobaculum sp.]
MAVVGVGRGLGSAVVKLALAEGAEVYAFARSSLDWLQSRQVKTASYDFSKWADAAAAAERVRQDFGVLNGLVVTATSPAPPTRPLKKT